MNTSNESLIREIIENWAEAIRSKDIPGILKHHAKDVLLFDVPEPLQSKGIDDYCASWDMFYDWYGVDGEFKVNELVIHAGSDIAFCHGIIYCSGTENGKKSSYDIRLTIGLEMIDGEWTIVHEHHSAPAK